MTKTPFKQLNNLEVNLSIQQEKLNNFTVNEK